MLDMTTRDRMVQKLQGIIDKGSNQVMLTMQGIEDEWHMRRDFVAKPKHVSWQIDNSGVHPVIDDEIYNLTPHSREQLYGRLQMPSRYADKLLEWGETELLTSNLERMMQRNGEDGVLIREVDRTIKGWLSPSYRRMDATPIFQSFVETMLAEKMVPLEGFNTNYRYQIRFLHPEIFEIKQDEFVVYGSSITTSDYGAGALQMEEFLMRIVCTNLALGFDSFRKIHIGRRWDGSDTLFSRETYELDTNAIASAVKDVAVQAKDRIKALNGAITEGVDKDIDATNILSGLNKKGIAKKVLEEVKVMYESEAVTELLPPGNGAWRLSNAISLIAQGQPADLRIDMEKEAMNVLLKN